MNTCLYQLIPILKTALSMLTLNNIKQFLNAEKKEYRRNYEKEPHKLKLELNMLKEVNTPKTGKEIATVSSLLNENYLKSKKN